MLETAFLTQIWSLVGLLGIVYLVFWRYSSYRVDWFRQEMFTLRDALFDEAAGGLIGFDHPAYGTLRSTMNGYIRFGHRITSLHLFFLLFFMKNTDLEEVVSFEETWRRATKNLDEDTALCLEMYRRRMNLLVWRFLFSFDSFLLIPLIVVFLAWRFLSTFRRQLWGGIRNEMVRINDAALVYGQS